MATVPFRRTNPNLAALVSDYDGIMLHMQQASATSAVFDIEGLRTHLYEKIIGQPEAIERILLSLRVNSANPNRKLPLGSFLLVGPPGTGKTQTIKELATGLKKHYESVDLASAGGGGGAMGMMFGVPNPYHGAGHGVFTKTIQANPPGPVICVDELEKPLKQAGSQGMSAQDSPIATCFYSLLNDGLIKSRFDNSEISAAKSIFGFTTNLKEAEVTKALLDIGSLFKPDANPFERPNENPFDLDKVSKLVQQLGAILHDDGNGLPKALINRFKHDIIPFSPIRDEFLPEIIIVTIRRKVIESGMEFANRGIDDNIVKQIGDRLRRIPNRSGRDIDAQIDQAIGGALSNFTFECMEQGKTADGATIRIIRDDTTGETIVQAL